MYDMSNEWDQYMLRYGGYSQATLGEFLDEGIATYDAATDTYTIHPREGDDFEAFTVSNSFA